MAHLSIAGDLTGIGRCPHCAVANPQMKVVWTSETFPEPDSPSAGHNWGACQCTSCSNLILVKCKRTVRAHVSQGFPKNLNIDEIFPTPEAVDVAIPESARKYLIQAHETLHAPDAAALMAASAVDAMLKEHGLAEGNLYNRIDQAVEQHILTAPMGQWAHAVRLEANNVRHADQTNPHLTRPQAQQVDEFASALGDFLYVLTAKIAKGVEDAK
jgi:hypothetical protein